MGLGSGHLGPSCVVDTESYGLPPTIWRTGCRLELLSVFVAAPCTNLHDSKANTPGYIRGSGVSCFCGLLLV